MLTPRPAFFLYRRRRPDSRRDSLLAGRRLDAASEEIQSSENWEFLGQYIDDEIATPFCGGMEPRPAWQTLLARAKHVRAAGREVRIVVDGSRLGAGDPFLPCRTLVKDTGLPPVYITSLYLREHALLTPLRSAWRVFDEWQALERARQREAGPIVLHSHPAAEILVRHDPRLPLSNLYFANPGDTLMMATCTMTGVNRRGKHVKTTQVLTIRPGRASLIETLFQGDGPGALELRIRIAGQGGARHGLVLITPWALITGEIAVSWLSGDSEPLLDEDFGWQDLPHPVTRRLALRRPVQVTGLWDDVTTLAASLSLDDIQKIDPTGRWNSSYEFLKHHAHRSLTGPALWVIERRADGRAIGICGVRPADYPAPEGSYELSCWLEPSARMLGYAREATTCVMRCAFDSLAFPHDSNRRLIISWVDKNDKRANRLADTLGMKLSRFSGSLNGDSQSQLLYVIESREFWQGGAQGRVNKPAMGD